jgi:hypothetical protein
MGRALTRPSRLQHSEKSGQRLMRPNAADSMVVTSRRVIPYHKR